MKSLWRTSRFYRSFRSASTVTVPSRSCFGALGVSSELCRRLEDIYGISSPTVIQEKCLPLAFEGRHVIANAETGSGKTLCFLLPILQKLLSTDFHSLSLVMVPTPDLGYQIYSAFQQLSRKQFHSSVAHSNNKLLIKPETRLLIATPTMLWQYNVQRILRDVEIVCYDEADILFVGGHQKESWNILQTISKLNREDKKQRQLILTAATLPGNTPKSVGTLLQKRLPRDTVFVNTHETHQIVSNASVRFVRFCDNEKNEEKTNDISKLDCLVSELNTIEMVNEGRHPKVLIFCNVVSNVTWLYEKLTSAGNDTSSIEESKIEIETKTSDTHPLTFTSPFPNTHWWKDRVAQLHKQIPPEERVSIINRFNSGDLCVLISTDVSSRGLDLPDITHVIMYDFPTGTVDFIHRAGRTARAGKPGKVITFVDTSDDDLAKAIESALIKKEREKEEGKERHREVKKDDLSHLFSRNKMLRRKFKRQSNRINIVH